MGHSSHRKTSASSLIAHHMPNCCGVGVRLCSKWDMLEARERGIPSPSHYAFGCSAVYHHFCIPAARLEYIIHVFQCRSRIWSASACRTPSTLRSMLKRQPLPRSSSSRYEATEPGTCDPCNAIASPLIQPAGDLWTCRFSNLFISFPLLSNSRLQPVRTLARSTSGRVPKVKLERTLSKQSRCAWPIPVHADCLFV